MFKRLFQSSSEEEIAPNGAHRNGSAASAVAIAEQGREARPGSEPLGSAVSTSSNAIGNFQAFDEIYRNAPVKQPRVAYDILKVAQMLDSQHLSGLSTEAKRCAVLMALEAAGVEAEDLLQDAMARQRALNDYEEDQQERLRNFEASKNKENSDIQLELERMTARYMARIQANIDEVAQQQDNFRAWQKRKQQELQCIAEAASFCAPPGTSPSNGNSTSSLTAVLARCGADAVAGKR
jgi:hypothetical protein